MLYLHRASDVHPVVVAVGAQDRIPGSQQSPVYVLRMFGAASRLLLLELGRELPSERIHDLGRNQLAHDGRSVSAKRRRYICRLAISAEARNG